MSSVLVVSVFFGVIGQLQSVKVYRHLYSGVCSVLLQIKESKNRTELLAHGAKHI